MRPGVAVAGGVAEGETEGMVLRFQRLGELQKPSRILGEGVESRFLHLADAIDEGVARAAERQPDPALAAGLEILPAHVVPAAVFLAQIIGEVGHVEQLLGVQVRVVEGKRACNAAERGYGVKFTELKSPLKSISINDARHKPATHTAPHPD